MNKVMSNLCQSCGNQIVVGCGPLCLVCQHTGRGVPAHLVITPKGQDPQIPAEGQALALAVAMDMIYGALATQTDERTTIDRYDALLSKIELTPTDEVKMAQIRLRNRIADPSHNRERPDLEAEREEEKERDCCDMCGGRGTILGRPCENCTDAYDCERD